MAVTLDRELVWQALRRRLGGGLAEKVCDGTLALLETYTPRRTDLVQLSRQVEDQLFRDLYELLGVRMAYYHSNGRLDRIRTDELPDLADAAMGALFASLRVTPANFDLIKKYAMQTGSFSALSLLVDRYASCQSEEELTLLGRILSERQAQIRS